MKNGAISTVFKQVYFIIFAAVNTVILTTFGVKKYLKSETDEEPILISICLKKKISFLIQKKSFMNNGGWKMFAIFTITWLLYSLSKLQILSKIKNRILPQKFGRYQRNVVTFFQTLLLISVQQILFFFLAFFPQVQGASQETVQIFMLITILVYIIVFYFFLPIFIISRLKTRINALFISDIENNRIKCDSFYVKQPDIVPRRDFINVDSKPISISSVIIKVEEVMPNVE